MEVISQHIYRPSSHSQEEAIQSRHTRGQGSGGPSQNSVYTKYKSLLPSSPWVTSGQAPEFKLIKLVKLWNMYTILPGRSKESWFETSLVIRWLGLDVLTAQAPGSIPHQGIKITQAARQGKKSKKNEKKNLDLHRVLENSGISRGTDRRRRGFSSCKVMENFGYCAINVKSQGN